MKWYVVHTHVNKEFVAEHNLNKLGFSTYIPKYKKMISHARKKSEVIKPLFPKYIFVKIDLAIQYWTVINSIYGVKNIITMNEKPTFLSSEIIKKLKFNENFEGFIDIMPFPDRKIGDEIKIIEGVFAGKLGIFNGLTDDNRVKVLFNLLGKEMTLSLMPIEVV